MKFYRSSFPLVSVLFVGGSKLTFKYNSFHLDTTLQTNALIASDEIVYATHLQIQCHTADEHVYRCSYKHVLCWRWTLSALEINTFRAAHKHVRTHVQTSATHTQTASYQQHPNRTYVKMIASHSYSRPKTSAITLQRSKRYLDAQWCLLVN